MPALRKEARVSIGLNVALALPVWIAVEKSA